MNERIKLIKHQASVWCDENIPEQCSEEANGYGSAWEDKFAELIVKECAEVAHCNFHVDGLTMGVLIKEHFGVE